MKIGAGAMKLLKIENGKGFFRVSKAGKWRPIDEIDKDDLMKLLDCYLSAEVEIDNIKDAALSNQAQQIIYESIADKLNALKANKSKFKDESDRMYLGAIEKYSQS